MDTKQVIQFTDAGFESEVLGSDQPVLVDFWAPWCGPCVALSPLIGDLAEQYDGNVKVGKINVDENPKAAQTYSISSIPAVLIFAGGNLVERLTGIQPKERYEAALAQAAQ